MTTTQVKNNLIGVTAAPTGVSAAAVAGGGTFAGSVAFFWKITATGPFGESLLSSEVTATPAASGHAEITVTGWPAGTTGYRLYRGTVTNTENVLVGTGGAGAANQVVWDTGGAGVAATPPSASGLVTVTKTVNIPAKSSLPALTSWPSGFGTGLQLALLQAECEWLCDAASSTSVPTNTAVALLAKKRAAAAGFLLQET